MATSHVMAATMPWHCLMRTRAIPPRGRQVDAAAEPQARAATAVAASLTN
jgi:hypothetical protein